MAHTVTIDGARPRPFCDNDKHASLRPLGIILIELNVRALDDRSLRRDATSVIVSLPFAISTTPLQILIEKQNKNKPVRYDTYLHKYVITYTKLTSTKIDLLLRATFSTLILSQLGQAHFYLTITIFVLVGSFTSYMELGTDFPAGGDFIARQRSHSHLKLRTECARKQNHLNYLI